MSHMIISIGRSVGRSFGWAGEIFDYFSMHNVHKIFDYLYYCIRCGDIHERLLTKQYHCIDNVYVLLS